MNKFPVINIQGEQVGQQSLPENLFGAKINESLINQAIRVFLSNQRQGGAKTKTRSEVSLTTKKAYRQKGTGNARHGAKSAPLFVGGGVSHGPTGNENYSLKLSKKMRRAALFSALSWMAENERILILDKANDLNGNAKDAAKLLKSMDLNEKKTALVVNNPGINIVRAWKNLGKSKILRADRLNTYIVMNSGKLIIDKLTVSFLESFYKAGKNAKQSEKVVEVNKVETETKKEKPVKVVMAKVETKTKVVAKPKTEVKSKAVVKSKAEVKPKLTAKVTKK